MDTRILNELYEVLENRKQADVTSSYTASLYAAGVPGISRKVMEEAYETVEAAFLLDQQKSSSAHLTEEIADLWYHTLVLACQQNIKLEELMTALAKRRGKSEQ